MATGPEQAREQHCRDRRGARPDARRPRRAPVAQAPQAPATERQRQAAGREECERSQCRDGLSGTRGHTGRGLEPDRRLRRGPGRQPTAAPAARTRAVLYIPSCPWRNRCPDTTALQAGPALPSSEAETSGPGAKPLTERESRQSQPGRSTMAKLTYAGICSRETPASALADMMVIAGWLARAGWHLASDGATGADIVFASGALADRRTVFLPYPGYNGCRGRTAACSPRRSFRCAWKSRPACIQPGTTARRAAGSCTRQKRSHPAFGLAGSPGGCGNRVD